MSAVVLVLSLSVLLAAVAATLRVVALDGYGPSSSRRGLPAWSAGTLPSVPYRATVRR